MFITFISVFLQEKLNIFVSRPISLMKPIIDNLTKLGIRILKLNYYTYLYEVNYNSGRLRAHGIEFGYKQSFIRKVVSSG